MLDKIRNLLKHTVIYGLGNFISRGITFFLLPLLTNSMSPAEYGKLAIIQTFIGLAEVFFTAGMRPSILRYSNKEAVTREAAFSGGLIWILIASIIGFAALKIFQSFFALQSGVESNLIYNYMIAILILDALSIPAYAFLQIAGKPLYYTLLKISNVILYFAGCVYLVVLKKEASVDSVMTANIVASGSLLLFCLPLFFQNFRFRLPPNVLMPMLRFGAPYIPNVLFVVVMDLMNRILIGRMLGLEAVGYFTAAMKLAMMMNLIVLAFQTAWQPFFLSHLKDPKGSELFARVFTYYLFATLSVFLMIGIFYPQIASLGFHGFMLIGRQYHSGLSIIPIVLMAYLFCGIYSNFIVGIYAKEKTLIIPLITCVGAIVNVSANFLLIPRFGLTGAAVATLLSYLTITIILYPISQRLFQIHYEWARIFKLFIATGLVFGATHLTDSVSIKMAMCFFFPILLFGLKTFSADELRQLKQRFPWR